MSQNISLKIIRGGEKLVRDFNETKGAAEAWNFWENDSIQKSHTYAKKFSIVGFRSFCLSKILTEAIVGTVDKLFSQPAERAKLKKDIPKIKASYRSCS